ncbi:MAG: peptide-methionine (S)-S-oxide reductase MsrA [Pseudomonadota bacterium]
MATRVLHKSLSPIAIVLAASAIVLGLIAVCAADERAGPLPAPFTVATTAKSAELTTVSSAGSQDASAATAASSATASAVFAGGCFWCVEADFDKVPGVLSTTSGYTGGRTPDPTYRSVTYGDTGHYEAVRVVYDPAKVSYAELLGVFWRSVDPTDAGGQFCDRGESYRTAIFVADDAQRAAAEASLVAARNDLAVKREIVTPILDAATFTEAEDYHQDYARRNPIRYKIYRYRCGRDARLARVWGEEKEPAKTSAPTKGPTASPGDKVGS